MSKEESIQKLQEKAQELIELFEGREIPGGRIGIGKAEYVVDVRWFIDRQIEGMRSNWGDPFNRQFIVSYQLLNRFKMALQDS